MDLDLAYEGSYPTPFADSPLLPLLLISLMKQRIAPRVSDSVKKEYDYIIVGAGSAGSVVANRLSEIPCISVLLLEAGKKPPVLTDVPSNFMNYFSTDIDWGYRTVPQAHTGSGLINRELKVPRGKVLGGSNILNGMLYVRGNKKNYDDWAAQGAKGWSYKDVLPYFLKLENYTVSQDLRYGYHAIGGPVTVEHPTYQAEIKSPLLEAAELLGYETTDPNGRKQTGIYDPEYTMRNRQRCSTAKAYLVPAENRTNLDIISNAFARKVLLENGRATGVEFDFEGVTYQVKAKQEVIMSAGSINTPQLLMLSGIGPKEELNRFNIPVIADLPVGKNFQDHCATVLTYLVDQDIQLISKKVADPKNTLRYIKNRTGPLTAPFVLLGFLNDSNQNLTVDFPNYELYFLETTADFLRMMTGMTNKVFEQVYKPYENYSMYECLSQNLQPRSRGTVKLQSSNPYDPPLIDPNYLSDPTDIDPLLQGMKTCEAIASSEAMKKVKARPLSTLYPGCEPFFNNQNEYFKCLAKSVILTIYHPVGTAKMGRKNDPTTVVDSKLRVKGIQGLRVVDASVMPLIPSGNTNVPTIMIAEKASDIIKKTIKC